MLGELTRSRVPEDRGRCDDDRRVDRTQAHAREQHLDVVGVFEIDPGVHEPGADRERSERHRLTRIPRSDDPHRLRRVSLSQQLATSDQPAKDRVGEIRLRAHQPAKLGVRDHEHATRLRDARRQERALAREKVQLADEPTRAVCRDDFVVFGTRADDLDLALEHHEEVFDEVARSEQQVTDGNRTLDTELPELVELRRTERRPCRVAGGGREGSRRIFLGCHGALLRRAGQLRGG